MNAADKLCQGIYNQFAANSGSGGIYDYVSGEMHEEEAPEGTAKPYIVYWIVTHESTWQFNEEFEELIVQFNCFAATKTAALTMQDKLTGLFSYDNKPSVTGYTVIDFSRTTLPSLKAEDFYMCGVQYEVLLQKT